jgi:hypothetical protein
MSNVLFTHKITPYLNFYIRYEIPDNPSNFLLMY